MGREWLALQVAAVLLILSVHERHYVVSLGGKRGQHYTCPYAISVVLAKIEIGVKQFVILCN